MGFFIVVVIVLFQVVNEILDGLENHGCCSLWGYFQCWFTAKCLVGVVYQLECMLVIILL